MVKLILFMLKNNKTFFKYIKMIRNIGLNIEYGFHDIVRSFP